MSTRAPMLRGQNADGAAMDLPAGKTCGDCANFKRCNATLGHVAADQVCDFYPSFFQAKSKVVALPLSARPAMTYAQQIAEKRAELARRRKERAERHQQHEEWDWQRELFRARFETSQLREVMS